MDMFNLICWKAITKHAIFGKIKMLLFRYESEVYLTGKNIF